MNEERERFEVNHLEFVGKQEDSGECKGFFRAYGAEYEYTDKKQGTKYIVTEHIENGISVVRFDSMILNYCVRLLPKRDTYTRVDSHPEILKILYPDFCQGYDTQTQNYHKLLNKFVEAWKKEGNEPYEGENFWNAFKDTHECKEFIAGRTGIVSVGGGFLSYDSKKEILQVFDRSGNYGRPSEANLLKLAPLILERANQLAPVKIVSLDFGKNFLGRELKNQMLEKIVSDFNEQYIAVEN